jgi:hypothetical protein
MPLVQFLITPANNGTSFPINFVGPCSIRVCAVQGHVTGAVGSACLPFQIQSDALIFPFSPLRFLTFLTNSHAEISIDGGFQEYHINNCKLNSAIILRVINPITGVQPVNFEFCLLTLQIEQVNRQWDAITNTSTPSR